MQRAALLLVLASVVTFVVAQNNTYAVPIPAGGRNAVHGWLILPFQDQEALDPFTDKPLPVKGFFYHHVPEFPVNSPHNFHIMIEGEMTSLPHAGKEIAPLAFPIPPIFPPYRIEWTFTPPPSFSLNDLLSGSLTRINGAVYNGSFDTEYERIPTNVATLQIEDLTTAYYLNSSSEVPVFENLQFFSYPFVEPKQNAPPSPAQFYMLHELNAPTTDYDQIVRVSIDYLSCSCECVAEPCDTCPSLWSNPASAFYEIIAEPGQRWVFPDLPNYPGLTVSKQSLTAYAINKRNQKVTCNSVIVQEEMHCTVGPLFGEHCDFNN